MNNVTGRSIERLRFGGTYSMESGCLGCDIQHANLYRGHVCGLRFPGFVVAITA